MEGGRLGSAPIYVRDATLSRHLKAALRRAKLVDGLTWYQRTRHTFAFHWVMDGRSMRKLSDIPGHASITTTERQAHPSPDAYGREDYEAPRVDLREGAKVVELGPSGKERSEDVFGTEDLHSAADLGTNQVTVSREGERAARKVAK